MEDLTPLPLHTITNELVPSFTEPRHRTPANQHKILEAGKAKKIISISESFYFYFYEWFIYFHLQFIQYDKMHVKI